MGQDYAARRAAKKRGKREGAEARKNGDRPRRRTGPRRGCTGPCYDVPKLTDDDVAWSDGNDEAPPPPPTALAAAAAAAATLAEVATTVTATPRAARARSRKKKGKEGEGGEEDKDAPLAARLTTAVGALPTAAQASPTGPALVDAAVLGALPASTRRAATDVFRLTAPTAIQAAAWPPAGEGRDVLMLAPPGAGKTLAYLVPVAGRVLFGETGEKRGTPSSSSSSSSPSALVLVPTRELARQVYSDARPLRDAARCACVYGGASRADQVGRLEGGGVRVLVATPGRLLDLVEGGVVGLANVSSIVLDEADKMLGLGLAPQLDALRALVPGKPRIMLASATLAPAVEAAAAAWLAPDAARVTVGVDTAATTTITQAIHVCAEHKKPAKLRKHLAAIAAASAGARARPRVLIFCNRVKTVRFVAGVVSEEGLKVETLHGERSQREREAALAAFRAGAAQVLVATDVGGRGLHVPALAYVVNYDFPPSLDTYTHRVGRAGRLGAGGHAFSFFTRPLAPLARGLVGLLTQAGAGVDPNLVRLADAYDEAVARKERGEEEGGGEEGEEEEEEVEARAPPSKPGAPLSAAQLPGLYRKRGRGGAGGSDSEEEVKTAPPPAARGAKKAVPGRLRKKLARERAAGGGREV